MAPRVYCCVYGCMNSTIRKPGLSFFKLPENDTKRYEWLRLICREDLLNRRAKSNTVCEEHFLKQDILPGLQRKKLKKTAMPTNLLPVVQTILVPEPAEDINNLIIDENSMNTKLVILDENSSSGQTSQSFISSDQPSKSLFSNDQPSRSLPNSDQTSQFLPSCGEISQTLSSSGQISESLSRSVQTSQYFSGSTSMKRKTTTTPATAACRKRTKINDNNTDTDQQLFHETCDKLLTKELADLVKAQTYLKFHYTENKYHDDYKMFCLNLYYTSPEAYRILQKALCLPSPKKLNKNSIPITSEINDKIMSVLKTKVDSMTDKEKICSVVIGWMSFKANLFYNIKEDQIIGFHEVDGVQVPEPATKGLVVMVRGIFVNWSQPIGYALLSECRNHYEISNWIDKLLERLFEIGLNIRTFVSEVGSEYFDATKIVTMNRPYFFINKRKIYYIFDAPNLIKWVLYNFRINEFHFQGRVAKFEHVLQFYNVDKHKNCKLAYKLTHNHIKPVTAEKLKVSHAAQLLSNSVAAGISNYVDFKVIDESGRDTVEFIRLMNNLFDSLNSSDVNDEYEYRRPFCRNDSQIEFFNDMLVFFQNLKLIHPKKRTVIIHDIKFIRGFQITLSSILLLSLELKREGYPSLLTRRLNLDVIKKFFGLMRSGKGEEPTCKCFLSMFGKVFLSNIVKPPRERNYADDLKKLLCVLTNRLDDGTLPIEQLDVDRDITDEESSSYYRIKSSDYCRLEIPAKNSIFYICSYLLQKCAEKHEDCEILKLYIQPDKKIHEFGSQYSRYRLTLTDSDYQAGNHSQDIVPCDEFIQYVERMEEKLFGSFKRRHINCKVVGTILHEITKDVRFSLPCPCFPTAYLTKLYIRMRIYFILKHNNKEFISSRRKRQNFTFTVL